MTTPRQHLAPLPAVCVGRRWLVERSAVEAYLAAQPDNGLARELLGRSA